MSIYVCSSIQQYSCREKIYSAKFSYLDPFKLIKKTPLRTNQKEPPWNPSKREPIKKTPLGTNQKEPPWNPSKREPIKKTFPLRTNQKWFKRGIIIKDLLTK